MPSVKPIVLDGSTLEGGGQLVRVALALSSVTGIPIHVHSIRANRAPRRQPKPGSRGGRTPEGGLKESHLAALNWLAQQTRAHVEGAQVGSREVTFIPEANKHRTSKIPTAPLEEASIIKLKNPGSVFLIWQAIFPYIVYGIPKRQGNTTLKEGIADEDQKLSITLSGGTNVSKAMSVDYVQQVFLPMLSRLGLPTFDIHIGKRGWAGPAAEIGEVTLEVSRPSIASTDRRSKFSLNERGPITKIAVTVVASPQSTLETILAGVQERIAQSFGSDMVVENVLAANDPLADSRNPRNLYILLVAHTSNDLRLGYDFLGSGRSPKNSAELNKIIEEACQTVVRGLKREVDRGGCTDEHMQDQLVIFQALDAHFNGTECTIDGGSWKDEVKYNEPPCGDEKGSLHTRTVRWVCNTILKDVQFEQDGKCRPAQQGKT